MPFKSHLIPDRARLQTGNPHARTAPPEAAGPHRSAQSSQALPDQLLGLHLWIALKDRLDRSAGINLLETEGQKRQFGIPGGRS